MVTRVQSFLILIFLVLLINSDLSASLKKRPYSIQLDFGGVQPALNDSAQVWTFAPLCGAAFQYMLSPQTGVVLAIRGSNIYNDSVSTSIFKLGKDHASKMWKVRSLSVGPRFYLQKRKGCTPFFDARMDVLFWEIQFMPSGATEKVLSGSGGLTDYSATELGITLGLGIEKVFFDRLGFLFTGSLTYLTDIGTDFDQSVNNSRSRALLQFTGGLSFNFGFKKKTLKEKYEKEMAKRDKHAVRTVYDGEIDEHTGDTTFVDQSRVRREGEFVPIEKGSVPYKDDDDMDGVSNRLDKCPDTPAGALVDKDGCPNDSDADGVLDGLDLCENTPPEVAKKIDMFGCPIDSDYDGVPDYLDQCPETPPAVEVDSAGCTPDRDLDGVDDQFDNCPDTPQGVPVNLRGCPDFEKIFCKRVLSSIFLSGSGEIKETSGIVLDSLADMLLLFNKVTAVIYGYTDDLGPSEANKKLSQKRADVVMKYLVNKGIEENRLQAIGMGETNFIASNRTKSGRNQNRRVEIEFSYSDQQR